MPGPRTRSPWRCGSRRPSSRTKTCWSSRRSRPPKAASIPRRVRWMRIPSSRTSRISILKTSASLLLSLLGAALSAQSVTVSGRVLLGGRDSVPLGGTWYDSLAYFSLPLNVVGRPAVQVEDLVVYRTSKRAPPVHLARHLVTIARPAADGTREVLEILELENTGLTTRITDDTLAPTWAGAIPSTAVQFQGGQGDISPEAMKLVGDSVYVLG